MKVLLALCRPLFPQDTGGKIRTLNVFSRLGEDAEVHAISLADETRDRDAVKQMRDVFRSYEPVFWNEPVRFSAAFFREFLRSRFSRFPYSLAKYRVAAFRAAVESKFREERFDVLVCDGLPSAAAMLESDIRPRVVFERNVEFMILKRQCEAEGNPLLRLLLQSEWRKTYAVEREVCHSFDHVVAVSEVDQESFGREFKAENVSAIPTGVNAEYYKPLDVPQRPGNLVFVGSMDWYPNEDGILWFIQEVYPQVQRACPHATLTVVGRNPSARVQAVADATVEIAGRVDDVRSFLARAEVVVVPLRVGSGTRIKIFEAMAMARPVVSTTIGAEGLPVAPGQDILLQDDPRAFAAGVTSLLTDRAQREAIGRAAREKVLTHYAWQFPAMQMHAILAKIVGGARDRLMRSPVCGAGQPANP